MTTEQMEAAELVWPDIKLLLEQKALEFAGSEEDVYKAGALVKAAKNIIQGVDGEIAKARKTGVIGRKAVGRLKT